MAMNNDQAPEITLRRQMDDRLMSQLDNERDRVTDLNIRLIRVETTFAEIVKDIAKIYAHVETLALSIQGIAQRLDTHATMEEHQWSVVNKANEHLIKLDDVLNQHLNCAGAMSTRLDWIERVLIGLCGAVASGVVGFILMRASG